MLRHFRQKFSRKCFRENCREGEEAAKILAKMSQTLLHMPGVLAQGAVLALVRERRPLVPEDEIAAAFKRQGLDALDVALAVQAVALY